MHWVKTASGAKFNLVSSDMLQVPLAMLGMKLGELEINGPGGYGYLPRTRRSRTIWVALAGGSFCRHVDGHHIALRRSFSRGEGATSNLELLLSTIGYLGARIRRFSRLHENRFAVDPEEVRKQMTPSTKLVVLTNLHNPSSAFAGEDVLREVGVIARGSGARVLVDEVYLDAVFDTPQRSAVHFGEEFVTTNSLTKVYGLSGIRCGWILAAPELAERFRRLSDLFHSTHVHPAELIGVRAFERIETLADRSRRLLRANAELLNACLSSSKRVEAHPHGDGLVAFPKYLGRDIEAFYTRLRSTYETTVAPGRFFGMENHFRIGIGRETEQLRVALERLSAALNDE
jgi:aspartate/methionine/tyrosine aminotransferase